MPEVELIRSLGHERRMEYYTADSFSHSSLIQITHSRQKEPQNLLSLLKHTQSLLNCVIYRSTYSAV